ncbi:MAG: low molecular weight phosphotyrosine protein phosphatase, partial [Eubacterium sp.]|nr:low molecular weight phosphotyrosine protein phosphatase [Eubacterium sp.]
YQISKPDYEKYDYIIGMDEANIRNINRMIGPDVEGKVYKLLDFAGEDRDIADPWYTGNFDVTYDDIVKGLNAFFRSLKKEILNNK